MADTNILGLIAGTLTTAAFIPQVVKTWQSKSADDISYTMFALFSVGVFLWLLYGIAISATPIIVSNAITLVLALCIVVMKIRFRNA